MTKVVTPNEAMYSDEFLEKIKGQLEAEKIKLQSEIDNIKKDENGGFPDYGDTEEDNAHEVADYEANLSIESDLQKALRDVLAALGRFKNGEYGICKYCHKSIGEQRLLARPTSSACVACKKTINQEV